MHENLGPSGGARAQIPSMLRVGSALGPAAADWIRRQRALVEVRDAVASSPLVRVVAIAATAVANGLAVECLALEIRELGAIAWLRFRPSDKEDTSLRPGNPVVVVVDNADTSYDVGAIMLTGHRRGGEFEIVFTPRPPDDVGELRLGVGRFVAPPSMPVPEATPKYSRSIKGPWTFTLTMGVGSEQR